MDGIKLIYYRSNTGEVFAYETEEERLQFGSSDLKLMSKEEVHRHLNPKPTTDQLASHARYKRDKALIALDEVVSNPLRFSDLLEEQRLEAATYRKLLLDIPQQKSFPSTYEMPKAPSWLT